MTSSPCSNAKSLAAPGGFLSFSTRYSAFGNKPGAPAKAVHIMTSLLHLESGLRV
jgi:hypothetical protein